MNKRRDTPLSFAFTKTLELLEPIECFATFGTLLGLTREGRLIEEDWDVDFHVRKNHADILREEITNSGLYTELPPIDDDIIQYKFKSVKLDFSLYEEKEEYLVDRFTYSWNSVSHLWIPKKWVYPISANKVPSRPERLCHYFYGRRWKERLVKFKDYKETCVDHAPKVTYL